MKNTILLIVFICASLILSSCCKHKDPISSVPGKMDVYVVGYQASTMGSVATYWKNGIGVTLTDGRNLANCYGIALDGNDVYAVGYVNLAGVNVAITIVKFLYISEWLTAKN